MSKFSGKAESGGGDGEKREVAPSGNQPAVLIGLIDLGTQQVSYGDQTKEAKKVFLIWELTSEPLSGTKDRNHVLGRDYTLSNHEKSALRQLFERWRGKKWKDGEDIDYCAGLGRPCLLSVVHGESAKGNAFAKVDGISPILKGMKVELPKHKPFRWTIEDGLEMLVGGEFVPQENADLPEWTWLPFIFGESIHAVIAKSQEWRDLHNDRAKPAGGDNKPSNGSGAKKTEAEPAPENDPIPW